MYDKYIQYDVDTRWNSTYRMIQEDWSRLKQLKTLLSKFDDFTSEISKNAPQISMALPIYYELHELLHDASDRCGQFSELDLDLVAAVKQGLKKYKKYYTFMDESDIFYTTTVLDPRMKGDLILKELSDSRNHTSLAPSEVPPNANSLGKHDPSRISGANWA